MLIFLEQRCGQRALKTDLLPSLTTFSNKKLYPIAILPAALSPRPAVHPPPTLPRVTLIPAMGPAQDQDQDQDQVPVPVPVPETQAVLWAARQTIPLAPTTLATEVVLLPATLAILQAALPTLLAVCQLPLTLLVPTTLELEAVPDLDLMLAQDRAQVQDLAQDLVDQVTSPLVRTVTAQIVELLDSFVPFLFFNPDIRSVAHADTRFDYSHSRLRISNRWGPITHRLCWQRQLSKLEHHRCWWWWIARWRRC